MLPSGSLPLFSQKHNPQYRSAFDTACQYFPGLPATTSCESFNKLLLPPGTHLPDTDGQAVRHLPQAADNTHTTRAGKDSHSIMIVIIIMISIR